MGWMDAPVIDDVPTPSAPPAPQGAAPAFESAPLVDEPAPVSKTPEPSMGQVAANAIPKGLANLLNTPMTLASLIMQGLANLPMAGHLTSLQDAANEPELKANPAMDLAKQVGAVDPAKDPQTGPQRIVDMAIQTAIGAAAVPAGGLAQAAKGAAVGAASGAAAQTTKELTGSDLLAAAVGMATPFAISALSSSSKKLLMTPTKEQTFKDAQDVGYVVEPSSVRTPSSKLETVAGKAAIAQDAAFRNQEVTNKLAAKSIGLPEDTPISMGIIEDVRKEAGKVYQEVADLSPKAARALDQLKQARFEASDYFRYYNKTGDPAAGKQARSWQARADALEKTIDIEAKKIVDVYAARPSSPVGNPAMPIAAPRLAQGQTTPQIETREVGFPLPATGKEPTSQAGSQARTINLEKVGETTQGDPQLLVRLRASRQLIARTHDLERAINLGDGNISAPIIGRMLDQGRPLTGELAIIGRFAQAFPRVTREIAGVPPPGVSGTDAAASAILATGGAAAAGGVEGAVTGLLPLLRSPARNKVLSNGYQSKLLDTPKPGPSTSTTAARAGMVGKTLAQSEGE